MVDAPEAISRARALSNAILERQYQAGLKTIQGSDWASDIYNLILNECPHLPEENVVRLFRNRHPSEAESVLGDALFMEYNFSRANTSGGAYAVGRKGKGGAERAAAPRAGAARAGGSRARL